MITRFFGTSRPIHIVIMALVTFIAFMVSRILDMDQSLTVGLLFNQVASYFWLVVSLLVLDFLVSKNNLTKKNSYKILLFGLFFILLPVTMQYNHVLLSNLFILLALRRIFSLRSNLNVKKKLFDAGFWIGMAALFYFWAILFFGLILAALLVHSIASIKDWIIPFAGTATVILLLASYYIVIDRDLVQLTAFVDATGFDFTSYNRTDLILGITILVSLGLWSLFFHLRNLGGKTKRQRRSHVLILVTLLIAALIPLVAPDKTGAEFVYLFAPLTVIMANYLEYSRERWFAEAFVWIIILTPLTYLAL